MNIGVLGTGFGAYHVELLSKMEHIGRVVVFGRNEVKLQKMQEELNVEVATDIADILFDADIDVIDICLPTPLHKHYAIEALKNGKHVFCETPVCYEMADKRDLPHVGRLGPSLNLHKFDDPRLGFSDLAAGASREVYGMGH